MIENLVVPNEVDTIRKNSFQNASFTSISLPNTLKTIEDNAFYNCSRLNTIIALGATPPTITNSSFYGISSVATVFVPCGSQMAYFSNWNMFEYNNFHEDCMSHSISINPNISGGTITVSSTQAMMGETITLTISSNPGHEFNSLSVHNANNPSQTVPVTNNTFIMPTFDVMVSAFFNYTSVDENELFEVSIYPNPTSDRINIETENLRHISINNILGQRIFEGETDGNEFAYDFRQYGEGVYLIRIETANGIITKRVAVTR